MGPHFKSSSSFLVQEQEDPYSLAWGIKPYLMWSYINFQLHVLPFSSQPCIQPTQTGLGCVQPMHQIHSCFRTLDLLLPLPGMFLARLIPSRPQVSSQMFLSQRKFFDHSNHPSWSFSNWFPYFILFIAPTNVKTLDFICYTFWLSPLSLSSIKVGLCHLLHHCCPVYGICLACRRCYIYIHRMNK